MFCKPPTRCAGLQSLLFLQQAMERGIAVQWLLPLSLDGRHVPPWPPSQCQLPKAPECERGWGPGVPPPGDCVRVNLQRPDAAA